MSKYSLYLESGPRKRTTMVHVLDLLGCIARGPTTDEALKNTPQAIRVYLRFLNRHGDQADPTAAFDLEVIEHIMEGPWLGYGNPAPGFGPDFQPVSEGELKRWLHHYDWMLEDLLQLIGELSSEQLVAEPEGKGRTVFKIIDHVAESQCAYIRRSFGKVEVLTPALSAVRRGAENLTEALSNLWEVSIMRLEAMSEDERTRSVPRGQVTWTARRTLRRMLEHAWEHLLEINDRLGEHFG